MGEGVKDFRRGDRVMVRGCGCFAEYVLVDPALATPNPPHFSWEQAAAIPISYVTAWEALVQFGRVKAGEWQLVAGASSGVGVASLQLGKVLGARVIGVSGSAAKLEKLRSLGLDTGIRGRGEDFSPQVLEATGGKGADLAVNLVGGTVFRACQKSLGNFGRLAVVGYVDGVMIRGVFGERRNGVVRIGAHRMQIGPDEKQYTPGFMTKRVTSARPYYNARSGLLNAPCISKTSFVVARNISRASEAFHRYE